MHSIQALLALVYIVSMDASMASNKDCADAEESLLRPGESAVQNRRAPAEHAKVRGVMVESNPSGMDESCKPLLPADEFARFKQFISSDLQKARTHLEASADNGYGLAQFEMGEAFYKGKYGWPVIYTTATKYFKLAIATMRSTGGDHRPAARALVSLYEKGSKDLHANIFLALKYLLIAEDTTRPGIVTAALEMTPEKYLYKGVADPGKYSFKPFEQFMESMKRLPSRKDEFSNQDFIPIPLRCLKMCEYMLQVASDLAELKKIVTSTPMLVNFIAHNLAYSDYPEKEEECQEFSSAFVVSSQEGKQSLYLSLAEKLPPVLVHYLEFAYDESDTFDFTPHFRAEVKDEVMELFGVGEKCMPIAIGNSLPSRGRLIAYCKLFNEAFANAVQVTTAKMEGFNRAVELLGQTSSTCIAQATAYEQELLKFEECATFFARLSKEAEAAFYNVKKAVFVFTPVREKLFKQDPKYKLILDALGIK